jgi:hypothetical protein
MRDPRYPIGKCVVEENITQEKRAAMIEDLDGFGDALRASASKFDEAKLNTPYREGGWTVRQLIHHLADSNLNWYARIKMALTEDHPQIKPFDQDAWSALFDARTLPPDISIDLIAGVNKRITAVLRSVSPGDFKRTMWHPERGILTIDATLQMLHWHMRHHIAHIESLRTAEGL